MKNRWIIALAVFIGIAFNSCEEFIEKDISDQWVYCISPSDFSVTDILTTTFKWKEVKGAEAYNLQIYRTTDSTFGTVAEFIADTNVRETQYTCTLRSGYYKWLIYGKNNGGETGLSVFRFTIDSTADISKQKVILRLPVDKKVLDGTTVDFKWDKIASADAYNFMIFPQDSTTAIHFKIVDGTSTSYTFRPVKATYRWRVSALKGNISSAFTEYTLTIDTTKPVIPVPDIIAPKNDTISIHTLPVRLSWNTVGDASDYTVQISKDSTYSEAKMEQVKTVSALYYDYINPESTIRYYWRVKANKDKNTGKYSKWWYFKYKK